MDKHLLLLIIVLSVLIGFAYIIGNIFEIIFCIIIAIITLLYFTGNKNIIYYVDKLF